MGHNLGLLFWTDPDDDHYRYRNVDASHVVSILLPAADAPGAIILMKNGRELRAVESAASLQYQYDQILSRWQPAR